jgi:hypothetical protein
MTMTMMKKTPWPLAAAAALPLVFALFVYAFFRSQQVVVNHLLAWLFGDLFLAWRPAVSTAVHPPAWVVYCLPGALWVFSAALFSFGLVPGPVRRKRAASCCPLLMVLLIEALQWAGVTDGVFDMMDAVWALGLWLLAQGLLRPGRAPLDFHALSPRWRMACLVLVYGIVYLSDVGQ